MKKVIKLTESDLIRLVKRIIKEDQESLTTYENEPIKSKWLTKMLNSLMKTYGNNIPVHELEGFDIDYIKQNYPEINIEDED